MMFRNVPKSKGQKLKNEKRIGNAICKAPKASSIFLHILPEKRLSSDSLEYTIMAWQTADRYPQHDFIEQTQLGNIKIAQRVQKPRGLTDQLRELEQIIQIFQPSFYSHKMEIIPTNTGSSKSEIRSSLERHFIIYKALKHHVYVYIRY